MGHGFHGRVSLLADTVSPRRVHNLHDFGKKYLMIVSEQVIKEVDCIAANKSLIFRIHEAIPTFLWKPSQYIIILGVKVDVVFVQILEQVVRAQDFGNLDKLIRIAITMKEGLFPEDHRSEHGAQ